MLGEQEGEASTTQRERLEYVENNYEEQKEHRKNDRKAYSQTEIACEVCKCTLRKCGWTKHVLM